VGVTENAIKWLVW